MLLTAISANIELSAKIKAELILFQNSKTMITSKFMALTENLVSFEQQTEEMTQDAGFWNKLTKVAESSKEAATHLTTQTTDKLGNAAKSSMEVLANTASKTGATLGEATTNTVHAVKDTAIQTGELAGKITTETATFVANTASKTGATLGEATTNTVHAVKDTAIQTGELAGKLTDVVGDRAIQISELLIDKTGDVISGVAKGTSVVTIWTFSQFAEGLMDGVKSSFASGFGLPAFCLLLGLIFIYRFVFKRPSKKVVYSYQGQSDSSSIVNDSSLIETPQNDVTQ